jgi:hypothetical protein
MAGVAIFHRYLLLIRGKRAAQKIPPPLIARNPLKSHVSDERNPRKTKEKQTANPRENPVIPREMLVRQDIPNCRSGGRATADSPAPRKGESSLAWRRRFHPVTECFSDSERQACERRGRICRRPANPSPADPCLSTRARPNRAEGSASGLRSPYRPQEASRALAPPSWASRRPSPRW